MKSYIIIYFLLVFYILFEFSLSEECSKAEPISTSEGCELIYCSDEEYKNKTCVISNSLIKKQWLNNIIFFGIEKSFYFDSTIDENNNIIFITSSNSKDYSCLDRQLYALNKYGYYLFDTPEKSITSKDNCKERENNFIIYVTVNNSENNFILNCDMNYCELIDYYNDELQLLNFFDFIPNYDPYSYKICLLKLHSQGNYFISSIFSFDTSENNHLGLFKFQLNYDTEKNITEKQIISENNYTEFLVAPNCLISCFETENSMIECLYASTEWKMTIAVFNNNLEQKLIFYFEDEVEEDAGEFCLFFKGINLQKEIGVYVFFYKEEDSPSLFLKNLTYDKNRDEFELIDMNISYKITINENKSYDKASSFYETIDLFKITTNRFGCAYTIQTSILILVLFDLFDDNKLDNIYIRYYKILLTLFNLNFSRNMRGFTFNNFIGIGFGNSNDKQAYYSVFFMFGYSNYSYVEKSIYKINSNNINLYYTIKLNDYINNNTISEISNNLFGYQFDEIKIISLTGLSSGIKYFLSNNSGLAINNTIDEKDEIIIDYSNNDINVTLDEEYSIKFGAFISEPDYEKLSYYTEKIESLGTLDFKNYYKKQSFVSKSIEIKYSFDCFENCLTCKYVGFSTNNQKCLSCLNDQCFMINNDNCYDIVKPKYNFFKNSTDNKTYCVPEDEFCPKDYPFERILTKECVYSINYKEILNNSIIIQNNPKSITLIHDILYNLLKNETINVATNDTIIKGNNVTFQITTVDRQNPNSVDNISTIILNQCEDQLKEKYKINGSLILFKIDIKRNDTVSTQVDYQVINPDNNEILDLSICANYTINIYAPVSLDSNTINLYNDLKNQGYDLFDSNDSFYNDICTPYSSINNTDVILKDRKILYYNNNITFCEKNCQYNNINTNNLKVSCLCSVQNISKENNLEKELNESEFQTNILLENFYDFEENTNFEVIGCYKLVFSSKGQKNNIGSIYLLINIFFFIIVVILHYTKGGMKLMGILKKMIEEYIDLKNKLFKKKSKGKILNKLSIVKKRSRMKSVNEIDNKKNNIKKTKSKRLKSKNGFSPKNLKISNYKESRNKNKQNKIEPNECNKNNDSIYYKRLKGGSNPPRKRVMSTRIKRESIVYVNRIIKNAQPIINIKNVIYKNRKQSQNDMNENEKDKKNDENNKEIIKIKKINNVENKNNKKNGTCGTIHKSSIHKKQRIKIPLKKINFMTVKSIISNKDNNSKNSSLGSLNRDLSKFKSCNESAIGKKKVTSKCEKSQSSKINKDFIDDNNNKNLAKIIKKIPKKERYKYLNDDELNNLKYEYAYEIDIRSYCQFYWSQIKTSNLIISTFLNFTDYNILFLKLGLFIVSFSLFFFINSVFFNDKSMQKLYENYGKYDIIYEIPQTIYSALTYKFVSLLLRNLALSQKDLIKLKKLSTMKQVEKKIVYSLRCLKRKFAIFYILSFLLLLFCWYFLSAFCAVYRNTQMALVKNSILSFIVSNSYIFLLGLIPGIFRLLSLSGEKNKQCLYQISQVIRFILV